MTQAALFLETKSLLEQNRISVLEVEVGIRVGRNLRNRLNGADVASSLSPDMVSWFRGSGCKVRGAYHPGADVGTWSRCDVEGAYRYRCV